MFSAPEAYIEFVAKLQAIDSVTIRRAFVMTSATVSEDSGLPEAVSYLSAVVQIQTLVLALSPILDQLIQAQDLMPPRETTVEEL